MSGFVWYNQQGNNIEVETIDWRLTGGVCGAGQGRATARKEEVFHEYSNEASFARLDCQQAG